MLVQGNISDPQDSPSVHVLGVVNQLDQDIPGPAQNTNSSGVPAGHQGWDYFLYSLDTVTPRT